MKIEWYTNACVRITAESGANILCDPWVNPGAFLGSWFHWPPLRHDFGEQLLSAPCDGIYITHLHPDHYDPKFISKFSKARPDVPIYIAQFAHPWLKRSVNSVVSSGTRVIEIPPLEAINIGDGFSLTVFAADTCNPLTCGVNVPCQTEPTLRGIDSVGVFKADGYTVVNANDAMGVHLVPKIAANIGHADFLMGHYGGASPYPQCFPGVENKQEAARKVVEATCRMLISAAEAIDVQYVMPFAGQYALGGKLTALNDDRATVPLDEAVKFLRTLSNKEIVSIEPFGEINLTHQTKSSDYCEPSGEIKELYYKKIADFTYPYDGTTRGLWESASEDLIRAAAPVLERSDQANIGFKNSFVIGDGKNFVTINLDPGREHSSIASGSNPAFENVTRITMPENLLRKLSGRTVGYKGFTPMHWNQADVGSHFVWERVGEYDLSSHALLNFFGV